MIKRLSLCCLVLLATSGHAQEVLITPSFVVTIIGCGEGVISCVDAKYVGVSRKTGSALTLTGKTLHTMAADGVTPNRFLGYEFRNSGTVYRVMQEGHLEVKQGQKVLVSEQGKWAP
ncbi:hypothetical protein FN976_11075 [Caenimonas sedimenti]|uniref:DUF2845 domain-containing protein n=1 Tax=Caenimonas sedimenti TaxID=2596921 RepID=A0A562ZS77_9BURK|nr:hypothetical protein [Caenimonas sedimenti]TWO71450.1 hypothetical protein FN976_11075 [Caenimonas sedimenti]